jgi:hypothetical protein
LRPHSSGSQSRGRHRDPCRGNDGRNHLRRGQHNNRCLMFFRRRALQIRPVRDRAAICRRIAALVRCKSRREAEYSIAMPGNSVPNWTLRNLARHIVVLDSCLRDDGGRNRSRNLLHQIGEPGGLRASRARLRPRRCNRVQYGRRDALCPDLNPAVHAVLKAGGTPNRNREISSS